MMDEIDIEEHDVLDNPTIRRIFPDLSVIKEEISKYYEEGPDTKPEPVSESLKPKTEFAPESPCITKDFITQSDHSNNPEDSGKYLQNNVIILGSKPSKLCTEKLNLESVIKCVPKVILENINLYLNKSEAYCKDCMVLFSRTSYLEDHKILVHEQRNKTYTTKKRNGGRTFLSVNKYKCNICISVLSSSSNLIRHLKNIHHITHKSNKTKNDERGDTEATTETLDGDRKLNILNTGANCFHCHKVFPTQKALVDHLYDILEPKQFDCKICGMKFSNQENLENHVIAVHDDKYSGSNSFECHKCAIRFLTKVKLDQHNQDKHINIRAKSKEAYYPLLSCEAVDSANEDLPEEQNEQPVKLAKRPKYESEVEELTEEDEPLILSKGKRASNKKIETPKENAKHKLRQKNDTLSSNITPEARRNNDNLKKESEVKSNIIKTSNNLYDKKILVEKAYQCYICSHYVFSLRNYSRHMARNHKIKNVPKVKKVLFDSQCKFCFSKLVNMNSYNNHIIRSHEEKTKLDGRKVKMETRNLGTMIKALSNKGDNQLYAFKSLLYKCNKCDINFMTAKTAMNHSEHMEVLINWKCCICNRIFKKIDKFLHVKQHSNSHSFTVYNICDTDVNMVLYLCLKCTINFSEDSFVRHYSTCGIVTPDSVYCKICDSLISKMDFDSHDQIHIKNKHIGASDFTIVETDLITDYDSRSNLIDSRNDVLCSGENSLKLIHDKSRLYLAFCKNCKGIMSFVSNFKATRKMHLEARCMHIKQQTCKRCGLVITAQTFKTHSRLHQEVKDLNIQSLFFVDLKSKKPIRPPVPAYPSCNICRVHFLCRNDIIEHECNGYDYLMCHVCQIKLSEQAFKFHMQFHEYLMENSKELQGIPEVKSKENNVTLSVTTTLDSSNGKVFVESEFLYSCKICKITFDAYDPVIKHCQGHYDRRKALVAKQSCQYCGLNFDETYYKVHEKMHSRTKYNVQSMKMINFDPFYFSLDNKLWIKHVSETLSADEIKLILGNSIYRFECRLKMEVFQAGPSKRTLYECEKCLVYVDPGSLYDHAGNTQCTKLKRYPCDVCGLCFDTAKYKMEHENLHVNGEISLKAYRLVRTNKKKDQIFHNMMFKSRNKFIMYQCRNCLVSVDKTQRHVHRCVFKNIVQCSHCGLLLCKQDYNTHRNRHRELEHFNTNHINVVYFGNKLYKGSQKIPSFSGTIFDYTFYKCTTCELCIRTKESTFKHECVFDDSKRKCPKCDLYFLREEFVSHNLLHEIDTDFEDNNLNIIIFDGQPNLKDLKRIVGNNNNPSLQNADAIVCKNNMNEPHNNNTIPDPEPPGNPVKLFKCDCGLHFIDKANARKHYNNCNPNMKISKQHCSKCDLLFTPGELFTHLLTHHGDKKNAYTFDISFMSEDDVKTPLFKCIKCNLHFVKVSEVNDHFDECDESGIGGEICKKCGLRFKLSSLYKNKHRSVCEKRYEIIVISEVNVNDLHLKEHIDDTGLIDSIITDKDMVLAKEYSVAKDYLLKIDLSKYNNVLYKCDVCNVYYVTESSWRRHKHFQAANDACSICGYNFSLQSLVRHNYIHHEKFNLKKDEFVIKSNNL